MYNNKKKVLLFIICGLIITMSIGFALLNGNFNITGISQIGSNFDIRITNIRVKNLNSGYSSGTNASSDVSGSTGCTVNNVSGCTGTIANFEAKLITPGDYIVYEVTVTNSGTLDGVVNSISLSPTTTDSDVIQVTKSGLADGDKITKNGGTNTIEVRVEYNSATTSQPSSTTTNITLTIGYQQDLSTAQSNQGGNSQSGSGESLDTTVVRTVYRFANEGFNDSYDPETGFELNSLSIGDSIENSAYAEDPDELNSYVYLKHGVNSEDQIVSSYIYFLEAQEHCLKGGNIESGDYIDNVDILNLDSYFSSMGFSCGEELCNSSDETVYMTGNEASIVINEEGMVEYGSGEDDEYCIINSDGSSSCHVNYATWRRDSILDDDGTGVVYMKNPYYLNGSNTGLSIGDSIEEILNYQETNPQEFVDGKIIYEYFEDLDSDAYLKFYVENYEIVSEYVCFITEQENCIKGGGPQYNSNIMTLKKTEGWFNSYGGTCTSNDSEYRCTCSGKTCTYPNGRLQIYAYPSTSLVRVNWADDQQVSRECTSGIISNGNLLGRCTQQ